MTAASVTTDRHLPGTTGARRVDTPLVVEVRAALESLATRDGIVLVQGPAGMGKTFAVDAVARRLNRTLYWLDLTGETSLTAMYYRLWIEVTGEAPDGLRTFQLGHELISILSERDCLLVVDEAQWADKRLLRVARSIYDRVGSRSDREERRFGLVLVGQNLDRVLASKERGLLSRASRNIKATGLKSKNILPVMSEYHPLFANTDPAVITTMWKALDGNWRRWAHVLETALSNGILPSNGLTEKEAVLILRTIGDSKKREAA